MGMPCNKICTVGKSRRTVVVPGIRCRKEETLLLSEAAFTVSMVMSVRLSSARNRLSQETSPSHRRHLSILLSQVYQVQQEIRALSKVSPPPILSLRSLARTFVESQESH